MGALEGKTVFITGGTRGIGRATAVRFAKAGAKVAICGRRVESLREAEAELKTLAPAAYAFRAGIEDRAAIEAGAAAVKDALGPIDILINNAGIYQPNPLLEVSAEEWDRQFGINLKGTFIVTQAVVPQMIENGGGRIVFVSSTIAQISPPGNACYTATKWGLEGFAGCVAQELLDHNITTHVLRPGFTDTTIFDEIGKPDMDIDWIDPDEIAAAAEFLCGLPPHAQVPELTYMTTFQKRSY